MDKRERLIEVKSGRAEFTIGMIINSESIKALNNELSMTKVSRQFKRFMAQA